MGTVYSAVDINLDRPVALKALKISLQDNPVECENLAKEARATALVNHPHVVKVFDFGQAQGQFYLAMELISGGSLDDLIQESQVVSEVMVLKIGIQIAKGLMPRLQKVSSTATSSRAIFCARTRRHSSWWILASPQR